MSYTDCLHPIWENDELYFAEFDEQVAAATAEADVVNEPLTDVEEEEGTSKSRYTSTFFLIFCFFLVLWCVFLVVGLWVVVLI